MTRNPAPEPTDSTDTTDAEMAHAVEFGSRKDAPDNVGPTEVDMPAEVIAQSVTKKAATRKPRTTTPAKPNAAKAAAGRKPTKSGDPRADRAAATKTAAPKAAKDAEAWTKLSTCKESPTRNQALAAYRKQRTALHGAGPEAYRKAAAKALGITDAAFEIAFYLSKATPKTEGKPEGEAGN